jgi:hypothetical protein
MRPLRGPGEGLRELLVWPARMWLRVAEEAGEILLSAWDVAVVPPLEIGARWLGAAVRLGERVVTPARALAVVALAATLTLGASQFIDYRAVEIGAPSYTGVDTVAPAPEMDRQTPRSAHGLAVLGIAVATLIVTVLAIAGRWRLARLLPLFGVAVILISLLVDAPEGLREGVAGTVYGGAEATLLGGFWAQLCSGVTLVVAGPLLAAHMRGERAARYGRRARRPAGPSAADALSARPGGSGAEGASP